MPELIVATAEHANTVFADAEARLTKTERVPGSLRQNFSIYSQDKSNKIQGASGYPHPRRDQPC